MDHERRFFFVHEKGGDADKTEDAGEITRAVSKPWYKFFIWIKHMSVRNWPWRLITAVVTGIVVAKALSAVAHWVLQAAGVFPPLPEPMFHHKPVLISLMLHSVFTVISAYITAVIAREKAMKAVYILGAKEAIFWLVSIALLWNHSPAWNNIVKAVLGPPLAWLGGIIYLKSRGKPVGTDN